MKSFLAHVENPGEIAGFLSTNSIFEIFRGWSICLELDETTQLYKEE
jgi:hypothetical protein